MTFELLVRPTTAEDISAIGKVAEATELFPASILPDMIANHFAHAAADIWLTATLKDAVTGFVFCEPERLANRTWNMRAIGVSPENQGKGIGAMLTLALESALRQREGRILIVETTSSDDQIGARAFYRAKGYAQEATLRDFWDVGVDKVVFRKAL